MRRLLVVLLALASCSAEPPEPVAVKKSPPKMTPAQEPPPPAPPPPLPTPPPAPPEPEPKVYRANVELVLDPPPPSPQATEPDRIYLPAFTIRTMDHVVVDVHVNGNRESTTSFLWGVSENLVFDPKIPVSEWPPAGATYVGETRRKNVGEAEVWIATESSAVHVRPGEHVLYVKGAIRSVKLLGALRLYVGKLGQPYRYTNYNAVLNIESEEGIRFARSIWFEPPLAEKPN
jgi:hypothetical protein